MLECSQHNVSTHTRLPLYTYILYMYICALFSVLARKILLIVDQENVYLLVHYITRTFQYIYVSTILHVHIDIYICVPFSALARRIYLNAVNQKYVYVYPLAHSH